MIEFIQQFSPVTQAFFATLFTWAVTAAGAGLVFFFKSIIPGGKTEGSWRHLERLCDRVPSPERKAPT